MEPARWILVEEPIPLGHELEQGLSPKFCEGDYDLVGCLKIFSHITSRRMG